MQIFSAIILKSPNSKKGISLNKKRALAFACQQPLSKGLVSFLLINLPAKQHVTDAFGALKSWRMGQ
jgi:hypothetical protein